MTVQTTVATDDRCARCHRDAHRPGREGFGPHGHEYVPPARKDGFIRQAGSHRQCARPGCTVRPSWRVILGHHVVQVYACQAHLAFAVELDLITENRARELGWETGGYPSHAHPNFRTIREVRVIPEISAIRRMNFAREVRISASFPQYEIRNDSDGPFEMSVWE
jgi:hypothetical protein